jgi:putative heme-binding domain-containing protein
VSRFLLPPLVVALFGVVFSLDSSPAQEPKTETKKEPKAAKKSDKKTAQAPVKVREVSATPEKLIRVKKDFKVERLYTVAPTQGSWVAMCVDPKGRLITSDQYGKLYRVTPPGVGGADKIAVEEIPADIGEAQGLVWAFDALYVSVNRGGKYASALYRVRSSKNDDRLDTVDKLRDFTSKGAGEHGPHAVILGPDGKSLYCVAGNHTPLMEMDTTAVPRLWGEDFILPRQWDATGHARGILAPGGWTAKCDKDGKNWELISMGYRNHYDIAFNREGELFTFDSDMEWDMNTPWYRPIRICHSVPGSDFGWRSGTGIYPAYYPDNLPPAADVGQGSPTGIVFGYGAKFPAKYQDSLFLCDWSYGKLYAAHLKPNGSTYTADFEEFLTGTPLPLTDIVINPKDGALYFTIGGRRVTSGLYRVTYVGAESTAPSKGDTTGAAERALRRKLESFYGKKDAQGVEFAFQHLNSPDRYIRWAARTVLEFNDPATYRERVFKEESTNAAFAGMLALLRTGKKDDSDLANRVVERLQRFDVSKLNEADVLDMLRLYELTFIRIGSPSDSLRQKIAERVDSLVPLASSKQITAEAFKLLVYLQVPSAAKKGVDLMSKAPTQEEQMEYALSLRELKAGWTRPLRENYFGWFAKAGTYRGGHSFLGFVNNIKQEAIDHLPAEEKIALKPILEKEIKVENPWVNIKPRPLVKHYTVEELLPVVEKGLQGRDFKHGRQMFGEAKCFNCHRFAGEGGAFGPDLTILSGRYSPRDVLDKVIHPSKVISDQYGAVNIVTTDGRLVTGRIINMFPDKAGTGGVIAVNTDMMDPDKMVKVRQNEIESMEPSKISMMPEGLLDNFTQNEVLDLVAYLLSRGNPNNAMFRKE